MHEEDQQNRQLLALSNQILALTKEVHAFAATAQGDRATSYQLDRQGRSKA